MTVIKKIQALMSEKAKQQDLRAGHNIKEFLRLLSRPRAVMILDPSGDPVRGDTMSKWYITGLNTV
jgi:6-phosphogluconate dehydrogenase